MKRRHFFHAAIAAFAFCRLPKLAAGQSNNSRGTGSSKAKDVSSASTPEKQKNFHKEFKPGDKVPLSSIYDVIHDKVDGDVHASPHQFAGTAGTTFPRCRVCREEVRFRLHRAAEHVEMHDDFKL